MLQKVMPIPNTSVNNEMVLEKNGGKDDDKLMNSMDVNEKLAKKMLPPTPRKRFSSS